METVSWDDAIEFYRRLDSLLPAADGLRCTLLSEVQWEYACRVSSASRPRQWVSFPTMPGVCRICTGMCRNGAWITGMEMMKMPPINAYFYIGFRVVCLPQGSSTPPLGH